MDDTMHPQPPHLPSRAQQNATPMHHTNPRHPHLIHKLTPPSPCAPNRKVLIDARKQVLLANREKENAEYEAKRAAGGAEH